MCPKQSLNIAAEEAKDADALASCFTEDGTVHDEGQDYHFQTLGVLVTVRARLTGDFPGSPVEVDHIFRLSSDKIASLEIRS